MVCISCGHEHNEKFCPNCGEKSNVPKITFSSTIQSSFTTITEMDKGFLYNLKNLTLKPKATVEEYLKGKRKRIFNPISFLIIAVTCYLIIESVFKIKSFISNELVATVKNDLSYKIGASGGKIITQYFKYFWVFTVIPLSFLTKLFFRRYNFAEHITINSFILGQVTLIVGSISFIIFRLPLLFNPFIYISLIWYLYRVFHNKNNKMESIIMTFAILLFFVLILFSIITTIGVINLT